MINSYLRVVDTVVLLRVCYRVEAELHFVEAVCKSEKRHIGSFYHAYELLAVIFKIRLVVSCNWDERRQLFQVIEVFKSKADIHFIEKADCVQDCFEFIPHYFVVNKGFFWLQVHILLYRCSN